MTRPPLLRNRALGLGRLIKKASGVPNAQESRPPKLPAQVSHFEEGGGREEIWLITSLRSEGLLHLICVAPQSDFGAYSKAFEATVRSVRFRN